MRIVNITTRGFASNCYLIASEREGAVVDPSADISNIMQTVIDERVSVKYILLTHAHFDHMLSLNELRKTTGAPLGVHEYDIPALSDPDISLFSMLRQKIVFLYPELKLTDGESLSVGEECIEVYHTPGHTPGSVCYRCGDKLLTGDTLFNMSVGRTDFPGGNSASLHNSIMKLRSMPDEVVIYPGHGEVSSIGVQKIKNPYIR